MSAATPQVYFIGAGPGDPDLITVKGRRLLETADVIIYADSLVHPALCAGAKPGAEVYGSSGLALEEITQRIIDAVAAGKVVARVHSGDPSIYGAIYEQMVALDARGISYEIVPGVSSAFAAAARLGVELTVPKISQTVIFTRLATRTRASMPEREQLRELARHGASLVVFLSIAAVGRVVAELLAGGYPPDTPAAVVAKATWHDELVIRSPLGELAHAVKRAKLTKQALILVGDALDPSRRPAGALRSHLYDPSYTHMFRRSRRPLAPSPSPPVEGERGRRGEGGGRAH